MKQGQQNQPAVTELLARIEELESKLQTQRGLRRLVPGRIGAVALSVTIAIALMTAPFQALAMGGKAAYLLIPTLTNTATFTAPIPSDCTGTNVTQYGRAFVLTNAQPVPFYVCTSYGWQGIIASTILPTLTHTASSVTVGGSVTSLPQNSPISVLYTYLAPGGTPVTRTSSTNTDSHGNASLGASFSTCTVGATVTIVVSVSTGAVVSTRVVPVTAC
jgi:hypothetical protein